MRYVNIRKNKVIQFTSLIASFVFFSGVIYAETVTLFKEKISESLNQVAQEISDEDIRDDFVQVLSRFDLGIWDGVPEGDVDPGFEKFYVAAITKKARIVKEQIPKRGWPAMKKKMDDQVDKYIPIYEQGARNFPLSQSFDETRQGCEETMERFFFQLESSIFQKFAEQEKIEVQFGACNAIYETKASEGSIKFSKLCLEEYQQITQDIIFSTFLANTIKIECEKEKTTYIDWLDSHHQYAFYLMYFASECPTRVGESDIEACLPDESAFKLITSWDGDLERIVHTSFFKWHNDIGGYYHKSTGIDDHSISFCFDPNILERTKNSVTGN